MQLKLTLNGSVDPFVKYLDDFCRIRPEILLEIDPTEQKFICKLFTEDKSCARYSAISFADCNMTIVNHPDKETLGTCRIKAGLLSQLNKFISIIKRFGADMDDEGHSKFDIQITYDVLANPNGTSEYIATKLACVSDVLTMRIDGFRPEQFLNIDDEKFDTLIFNVTDPITFILDSNTVDSIIKNSDIMKVDVRTDALHFCNNGKEMWVKFMPDHTDMPYFEYKIGVFDTEPTYPVSLSVYKKLFTMMLNKTGEDYTVILGRRPGSLPDSPVERILFRSNNTDTKMAISALNTNR